MCVYTSATIPVRWRVPIVRILRRTRTQWARDYEFIRNKNYGGRS